MRFESIIVLVTLLSIFESISSSTISHHHHHHHQTPHHHHHHRHHPHHRHTLEKRQNDQINSSDSSTNTNDLTDSCQGDDSTTNSFNQTLTTREISIQSIDQSSQNDDNDQWGLDSPGNLQKNGVYFGLLPDDGDAGGSREKMSDLNLILQTSRSSTYGWYSQVISGKTYDGSQLLEVLEDVKNCQCVFQPAVMPINGWKGLTSDDNSQAIAIAKVMKIFTDQGIPVWLRFAHEMNYYQSEGTYKGNPEDFKAAWDSVSSACKKIAPLVKMWWTPNVASLEDYKKYEPWDMSTVDLVGIDYYPKSLKKDGNEFIETMKSFHDRYAINGRMFAIGETGLGYAGSESDRLEWLSQLISAKDQLPNYLAASWFNYQKDYDYRIVKPFSSELTNRVKDFFEI